MIIILLTIIAISEILRLILTHRKTTIKKHFTQKLEGTQKMIWDLVFKKFKTQEIREEIRKEHSFMKSRIETLKGQIDTFPKEGQPAEKARLDDQLVLAERDLGRLESQLQALDLEISGAKPSNQYPDGVRGINDDIDSLQELVGMLKNYIKSLR